MVRHDAIGNTFARWVGSDPKAPAVGTGSHIDAIPNAGKYDGVVGVLGGLEAIRALQRSGFRPKNSIELLVFTSEEPTRFGIGCLGSRLLSGTLSPEAAEKLNDKDGESVDDVRRKAGMRGDLRRREIAERLLQSVRRIAHRARALCWNANEIPLGIVTKIAAPASGSHHGRRRRRSCRRSPDARSSRRSLRGGGTDPGHRECSANQRLKRHGSHRRHVRRFSRRREQHSEPRSAQPRYSRYRSRSPRLRDEGNRSKRSRNIAAARQVSIHTELLNADAPADCAPEVVDALSKACENTPAEIYFA